MTIYTVLTAAGLVFLVTLAMVLVRAFLGPTVWDRILATNAVGTKTVIFVAILGFIMKRPEFLDISLLYAVLNFVATIAILKIVEYKRIG
jgi:multicomponent Na+:H+ antiporter subunit F